MVNNVHRRPARGKGGAAVVSGGNGQAAGVRSLVPPLRIAERGKGGEVSRAVTTYARRLGLFSGTMAVIGGIIGAGIFRSPPVVAQRVGTAGLTLAAWGLGGVIALAGGLCFGELGARKPQAGGGYVYLRDAFGPLPAFLYGWALLLVIATGAIGAVAVTFATYVLALAGLSDGLTIPVAVGAIAFLTGINYVGVKPAAVTQNIFTVLKLAAVAALIAAGLFVATSTALYRPLPPSTARGGAVDVIVALGAALVPVLFTYGGWQQTNFIAEEIIEPERNLPRALVLGVAVVVAVYLLANVVYLRVLGVAGLAASTAPAHDVMVRLAGPAGGTLIDTGIAVSTFGFLDLVILVSPRVYQAMAADGLFFGWASQLHPRYRTPAGALVFQGAWAVVLTLSGTYADLLDWVVFGDWIFFGLAVATLFVYRTRAGDPRGVGRPAGAFRVPGYPWVPALFVTAALYVVASSVRSNPGNAVKGTCLLALGVPVFLLWRAARRVAPPLILLPLLSSLIGERVAAQGRDWMFGPFERPTAVNPVIAPSPISTFLSPMNDSVVRWEEYATFNPAAVVKDGRVYVLYRAEDGAGEAKIGRRTSRIGLAESGDGLRFTRPPRRAPVLYPDRDAQAQYEWPGGVEDPRIVETEDGGYLLTYTQWNRDIPRLAIATSRDLVTWTKHGPAFAQSDSGRYRNLESKSGAILARVAGNRLIATKVNGKYWMYFNVPDVLIATSDNLIDWVPLADTAGKLVKVLSPRPGYFDSWLVEAGPPAITTEHGILLMYNAGNSGAYGDAALPARVYTGGQALYDPRNPLKLIARSDQPFIKPTEEYERAGQYVAGTTFVEGLVPFNGRWYLYYGTADSRVAVAVWDPKRSHVGDGGRAQ